MIYTHTQVGTGPLIAAVLGTILLGFIMYVLRSTGRLETWSRTRIIAGFTMAAMLLMGNGAAFSRMTIAVEDGALSWSFAFGLFRRRVPLTDIASVAVVQTASDEGWGIHETPRGTLYNVSGSHAVHVTLRDGSRFQLGTDQPEQLRQAIIGAPRIEGHSDDHTVANP